MGKKQLAVCIPTYNRPEVIKEVLSKELYILKKYDIDVYIYDSSTNDDTEKVTNDYKKVYENIYYIAFPSDIQSNIKVYQIYKKYGWINDYSYVWMTADYIIWDNKLFDKIAETISEEYDLITPNIRDYIPLGDMAFNSARTLVKEVGWYFTLYGSVILNTSSMVDGADFDGLLNKYGTKDTLFFSHFGYYLERMKDIKGFKGYHINAVNLYGISKKKPPSEWRESYWETWCEYFPKTIEKLPKYYEDVKHDILSKNGKYAMVLNLKNFLFLRKDGRYDLAIYKKYKDRWNKLTDVSSVTLRAIAVVPMNVIKKMYGSYIEIRKDTR